MCRLLLACCLALASLCAVAQVAVPVLKDRVTDLTASLSATQRDALEARLAAFEAKKGSQIAVLLVPSTRPEEIEQFATRVFDQWKLGRKGVDDGLLLVVAKEDRRLRIEVGYGLEGVIPDSVARRVISETITPRFRANDIPGGLEAGLGQLMRLVEGESLPPAPPAAAPKGRGGPDVGDAMEWLVPLLAFVVIGGSVLKRVLGRFPGALVTGLLAGLAGWVLVSLGVAIFLVIAGFVLSFVNTGGWRGGGGWSTGGGGWSPGGGGSGWGGGGGSSGGGGASGSW